MLAPSIGSLKKHSPQDGNGSPFSGCRNALRQPENPTHPHYAKMPSFLYSNP
ncbi:MAG: hypothetical protein ACFNLD_08655 [Kingella oralis]|uniref:hypothetical protein n=1 Tax=Kingella oralis TaxID=505 RepID=UPI0034E3978C